MKDEVNTLLQKQMDRKDFLRHVAIGFAAIAGVTAIAKTIATMNNGGKSQSMGYGVNSYGGDPKNAKQSSSKV